MISVLKFLYYILYIIEIIFIKNKLLKLLLYRVGSKIIKSFFFYFYIIFILIVIC